MTPGELKYVAPHRGAMVLTLGILGIVLCPICAVIALVMGKNDLRAIDGREMDPSGRGLTQAGWILGIIGSVFLAISLLLVVLYLVIIVFLVGVLGIAAASGAGGTGGTSSGATPTAPSSGVR